MNSPTVNLLKLHIKGIRFSKMYSPEETCWVLRHHILFAAFLKINGSVPFRQLLLEVFKSWDKVIIGPQLRQLCNSVPNLIPWTSPILNYYLGYGGRACAPIGPSLVASPPILPAGSQSSSRSLSQQFSQSSLNLSSPGAAHSSYRSPKAIGASPTRSCSATFTSLSKSSPSKSTQPKSLPGKAAASQALSRSPPGKGSASYQPLPNLGLALMATISGYQNTAATIVISACLAHLRALGDVKPDTRAGEIEAIQLLFEHLHDCCACFIG
ncbi:hypothetical protein FRC12_019344 [Ceratobasidium sp. 428]|nr:hypothetical protein FRC12_019344 [Ceratobasidium sp. 428]